MVLRVQAALHAGIPGPAAGSWSCRRPRSESLQPLVLWEGTGTRADLGHPQQLPTLGLALPSPGPWRGCRISWRPDTHTVQWSVRSADQGTATSMELTKPSTSSSGDSIDLRTSFTDWARGRLNQLTETPDTATRHSPAQPLSWRSPRHHHPSICSLQGLPSGPDLFSSHLQTAQPFGPVKKFPSLLGSKLHLLPGVVAGMPLIPAHRQM